MEFMPMLAAITGDSLVSALIWVVIAAVVFFLCNWFIGYVGIGEPFAKVAKVIIAVIVLVLMINALLMLAGRPLFRW